MLMKIRILLVTFLAVVCPAYAAIDAGGLEGSKDNAMTVESPGWIRVDDGAFLGWDEVRHAHESGLIRAAVRHETKAFDRHNKIWVDIPNGAELASISERCTGWMNGFITATYAGHDTLSFREWDVAFRDKASGNDISDLLETCQRSNLTRTLIVAAQQEGLVQAFTNKALALIGENGALIYVGPHFRNREPFEIEWQSHSTSGILRIAANRHVVLENEPCRPFSQVKIQYAGGTFLIRAVDLDIRIGGQNLSKTPLGPAFSLFCDEK